MHMCRKVLVASFCAFCEIAANSAEFSFSSQDDFIDIGLYIRDIFNTNPDLIALEVTLTSSSQRRLALASSAALGEDLTLLIDGKTIQTSHLNTFIDTPQLQFYVSKPVAIALLPSLLDFTPGSSSQATPVAASAQQAPIPSAAASSDFAATLLSAAVPAVIDTQVVIPPSVSVSTLEIVSPYAPAAVAEPPSAPALGPVPALASTQELTSTPLDVSPQSFAPLPPNISSTPLLDALVTANNSQEVTSPSAFVSTLGPASPPTSDPLPPPTQEIVSTPVVDPLPAIAPQPVMPGWALGTWLPTRATPSQYAEINEGDPVTISANALDAITCNKAGSSVIESNNTRVRLQLAKDSECVIDKVQADRVVIHRLDTPGKIVISLYAHDDDMHGAPAKEGTYRRK